MQRNESDLGRVFPSGVRIGKVSYGLGVFAFAFISKGTPLGRIQGTIINDPNYSSDYCISAGENKVLEPGPPFCYLNHSCEPNCQIMQYVREDSEVGEETLEIGTLSETEMDLEDNDFDDELENQLPDEDGCFYGDGAAAEIETDNTEWIEETQEKFVTQNNSANSYVKNSDQDFVQDSAQDTMQFEDDADAELWIEAIRDIMPGEELTIDYAWPADREAKCLCGSPQCRGWIVDPDELHLLQGK
ncbi:MAG: SET domain-containing protein-lysine N-methyltransferase [Planctomycetaceae bacterium]|jgi:hypothetical protein|nr:SET domain-containing protein-lysine N-methyltransferase [Planctomycetaceae bacterium]